MNVDNHEPHARRSEGGDHDRRIVVDGPRSGSVDFDDEGLEGMSFCTFVVLLLIFYKYRVVMTPFHAERM